MELLTYPVISAIFFAIVFITKKRFGLLGLALAAGSILSDVWQNSSGLISKALDIQPSLFLVTIVSIVLVILPAIVLLFHGHSYKTLISRIIGSVLFTILAMALLIEPLSRIIIVEGFGSDVFAILSNNRMIIVGFCLIMAVVDLFLSKPAHSSGKNHKH